MGSEFVEEEELRRLFTRRAMLLGMAGVAGFTALGGRLYQLQVMDGSRYAPLAEENRLSLKALAPVRGRILDAAGLVMASNEETFRVIVDPSSVGDMKSVLDLLTRIVPVAPDVQEQLLLKALKSRAGTVVAASDLTFEQVAEINLLAPQLPGVETEIGYVRKYPRGAALAHVTGYVGSVDRRALDDDPALRVPGMRVGKTGIERGMEPLLRGAGGSRRYEVDARGRTIRYLEETPPVAGEDVVSTIDAVLQARVMELIGREKRAAAVVMEAATGEVVAMASVPTFDPNDVSDSISQAAWRRLVEAEHKPMLNRVISGGYPPGSIFKIVTALAGLEAGVIDPKEKVDCSGDFAITGQHYRCWKRQGHGPVDLHRALRESCDVYFYEMAKRLGIGPLAAMARRLGLGEAIGEGVVLERSGVVPDADWKKWRFGDGWSLGDTVLTGIGQGYALATPLQLAVMMARVATGNAVLPRVVRSRAGTPAAKIRSLGLSPDSLAAVRAALIAAVNESGGTGAAAKPAHAVVLAGKTGTSQVRRARDDEDATREIPWELRDHALFVAYFPAEAPRFVIATVVEHGGGGGTAAAPYARAIAEMLLDDDPARRRVFLGAADPGKSAANRATIVSGG